MIPKVLSFICFSIYLFFISCRYARQVAEFFEFVKKKKEVLFREVVEVEKNSQGQPQVLLPHEGSLWLPDGKPFPQSALKPLDFRRAMSFMSG